MSNDGAARFARGCDCDMVSRGDVSEDSWLSASWPRSGCGGEGDGDGAKCGVEGRMYKMIHDSIFRVRAAGEAVSFSRHADTD